MTNAELATLARYIADGIRVLRTRDGKPVTDEECQERGNGLATILHMHYFLVPRPEFPELAPEVRHLPGCICAECTDRPAWHSWSCRCDRCEAYRKRAAS